ncbi:MAG: ribbon-helix-helix domain-containing protein [Candidatus Rokuibacteriota bacterium]
MASEVEARLSEVLRAGLREVRAADWGRQGPPALSGRCESHTFEDMKDAVITVRLPRATRERIEELARREGRSLSQQVERLIARSLDARTPDAGSGPARLPTPLTGTLRMGRVPTLADFRTARKTLSASLRGRLTLRGDTRR